MFLYLFVIVLGLFLSVIFGILIMLPIILFLIIVTIHLIVTRSLYIRKIDTPKSLSFAIKSMQQKKSKFRRINRITFLSSDQKKILKKLSFLVDDLFLEGKELEFEEDYFGDPSYSISVTNMFHTHKKLD